MVKHSPRILASEEKAAINILTIRNRIHFPRDCSMPLHEVDRLKRPFTNHFIHPGTV